MSPSENRKSFSTGTAAQGHKSCGCGWFLTYRYFLCGAVGGEELHLKLLTLPLHAGAPLAGGLHLAATHTHTKKVVISRQTEEKEKKKPRKPPRVSHTVSLAGKYLLFYLLERRLLDDALHRLLLDGLCDLLLSQREILQEGKRISSSAHVEDGDGCCSFLTSNLSPYLVSCDLKGVGVQGDESRMERQMFGVLKLSRMKKVSL